MDSETLPQVVMVERTKNILDGVVQSRSSDDRVYYPRIILQANFLDTCTGSQARDSRCVHLRSLLEQLDAVELRQWILDAQVVG